MMSRRFLEGVLTVQAYGTIDGREDSVACKAFKPWIGDHLRVPDSEGRKVWAGKDG